MNGDKDLLEKVLSNNWEMARILAGAIENQFKWLRKNLWHHKIPVLGTWQQLAKQNFSPRMMVNWHDQQSPRLKSQLETISCERLRKCWDYLGLEWPKSTKSFIWLIIMTIGNTLCFKTFLWEFFLAFKTKLNSANMLLKTGKYVLFVSFQNAWPATLYLVS